jgi:hypothetical protein
MPRREARPYEPGNVEALRHGAWSARSVEPVAVALCSDLAECAPWTRQPAFRGAVESWAHAEAQVRLLREYVAEHGALDERGVPRPCMALLDRTETRLVRLRDVLGLSPAAWSRLVATLGSADAEAAVAGLERLRSIGRELSEAVSQ